MKILLHVSLFLQRGDSVLLVQEADPEDEGRWNLPGGHIEPEETILMAGYREAQEETGLTIALKNVVGVYSRTGTSEKRAIRFVLRADAGSREAIAGNDVVSVRWFKIDELTAVPDTHLLNPAQLRSILADGFDGVNYPLKILREQ